VVRGSIPDSCEKNSVRREELILYAPTDSTTKISYH
jgi:hypothetical protein